MAAYGKIAGNAKKRDAKTDSAGPFLSVYGLLNTSNMAWWGPTELHEVQVLVSRYDLNG